MEAHNRFAQQVGEKGGKLVGGNALQPTGTATTIRGDVVTDGPFAETKEALGGYYLIEAADLDEAIAIAKQPRPVRRRRGPADHGVRRGVTATEHGRPPATRARQRGGGRERPSSRGGRRRRRAPSRVGLRARRDGARRPRHRPRRGVRPGRLRARRWTPGPAGRAAQPRRLADDGRPARALDLLRRETHAAPQAPAARRAATIAPAGASRADDVIPDDRLRLIFTCCHPALAPDAQVALTLRLVCGLTTAEVARAFLVSEPTMAARLTRAKKKIAAARIPYRVPPRTSCRSGSTPCSRWCTWSSRPGTPRPPATDSSAPTSSSARSTWRGCCARCCRTTEVAGLLALILLTDARRATRCDAGRPAAAARGAGPLAVGPRAIAEGLALVREALRGGRRAASRCRRRSRRVHAEAPSWEETDWAQIVALYDGCSAGLAVAGRRAQPRRRRRHGRRARSRPGRARRPGADRRSRPTATSPPPAPTSSAAWAAADEAARRTGPRWPSRKNSAERDFLGRAHRRGWRGD